jgi:hypothetical protein
MSIKEVASVLNFVNNTPLKTETPVVGWLTTESAQPPQGQVMKLIVRNLPDVGAQVQEAEEQKAAPSLFGEHIREGIAVVKDWMKKP